MKKLFTLFAFIAVYCSQSLLAQCTPILPSSFYLTPPPAFDTVIAAPDVNHYLCYNSSLYYLDNSPDTIYMEPSSRLTIGSCFNLTVYMSNNCQLIIDTTTAYPKHFTSLTYDQNFPFFTDTASAVFDTIISCPSLTFSYINHGGASPCLSLGNPTEQKQSLKIFPNPTNTGSIQLDGLNTSPITVVIMNSLGSVVNSFIQSGNNIDLKGLPTGMYIMQITQEKHSYQSKVIIQ